MGAGPAGAGLAHNEGGARASCTSIFSLFSELVSSNLSPDLGFAQVSSYPTVRSSASKVCLRVFLTHLIKLLVS